MFTWIKQIYHLCVAVFSTFWFGFPAKKLTIIGVTGTDGKTTTATLLYEIAKKAGLKTSMITSVHAEIAGKTYDTGFHVTTPTAFSVQKFLREAVNHGDTHMILEVTSHGISQYRVWGIPFEVGILTNVTHEHLDWHKTYEAYLQTKLKLLERSKIVVVNKDETVVYKRALKVLGKDHKLISYGLTQNAIVNPISYQLKTQLPGDYNKYNCLAALSGAIGLNIDPSIALQAISEFSGVIGRMEIVASTPYTVIVDFAHTPNALKHVLHTARNMTQGKLIHVFGSAGLRDISKRPLMGKESAEVADTIVLTEEDYRTENIEKIMDAIQTGIPKNRKVYRYPNRQDAIRFALSKAKPGDLVLLTGKGHEKSLCRGTVEYLWSDQEAVAQLLASKKGIQ